MEQSGLIKRYSILFYWIVPLVLGIIQFCFDYFPGHLKLSDSLLDGLIFCGILGAFGMAIWFVARYNSPEDKPFAQLVFTHLAAAAILTLSWSYLAGYLSRALVHDPVFPAYLESQSTARFILGYFFFTLMATVFNLYIIYASNRQKANREKQLQQEVREAVLRALKSQINPHFLFNSLNSIASLTLTRPEKAHEMVITLSDFMRYSLRKQHNELVSLEEEINNIRLYLQIEKIRFGDKMAYTIEMEPDCLSCPIPTLLLQPLFENAVKYGVYEAAEQVMITLKATREAGHVALVLSNNYDPESVPSRGEGIGLINVRERLRLVYNSNSLIRTEDQDGIFTVKIFLPFK